MAKGGAALGRMYGVSGKAIREIGVEQFMRCTDMARQILINEYLRQKKT